MPMKWPTGAPVIWGGPPFGNMWSSWRVSNPIVRCECTTPLGSRVVPDVKAMTAGASGSTGSGPTSGSVSSRSASASARAGSAPAGVSPATSQRGSGRSASSAS